MSLGSGAFALIVAVVAIGILVVFFGTRRHPEQGVTNESDAHSESTPADPSRGTFRPAGPGAETMRPENLGGDQAPPAPPEPGGPR